MAMGILKPILVVLFFVANCDEIFAKSLPHSTVNDKLEELNNSVGQLQRTSFHTWQVMVSQSVVITAAHLVYTVLITD